MQYIFGVGIIQLLGVKYEIIWDWIAIKRVTGLGGNTNITAEFFFLGFILFDFLYKKRIFLISKNMIMFSLVISFLGILISTSKHCLLLLGIYLIYKNSRKKDMLLVFKLFICVAFFIIGVIILYSYNLFWFRTKINMYLFFFQNFSILDTIGFSKVEGRAKSTWWAINYFINNFPLGLGIGTWGDNSSSFNPFSKYVLPYLVKMSDSYIAHILVENGILSVLYFVAIFVAWRSIAKRDGTLIFWIFIASCLVSMVPSSISIPFIYSWVVVVISILEKVYLNRLRGRLKIYHFKREKVKKLKAS